MRDGFSVMSCLFKRGWGDHIPPHTKLANVVRVPPPACTSFPLLLSSTWLETSFTPRSTILVMRGTSKLVTPGPGGKSGGESRERGEHHACIFSPAHTCATFPHLSGECAPQRRHRRGTCVDRGVGVCGGGDEKGEGGREGRTKKWVRGREPWHTINETQWTRTITPGHIKC